jgi:hypothetical protein
MCKHRCSLTQLYSSLEVRMIVRSELSKVFDCKVLMLIDECSSFRPFLVLPLRFYNNELKELFIEEGIQLDTSDDLEKALNKLGYLKFEQFLKAKENFYKSAKIIKLTKVKQVKFNLKNFK